LKITKLL